MNRIITFSLVLLLLVSVLPVQQVKADEGYPTFEEYFSQFDLSGDVYEQFINGTFKTNNGNVLLSSNINYYFHFVFNDTNYLVYGINYQPYIVYDASKVYIRHINLYGNNSSYFYWSSDNILKFKEGSELCLYINTSNENIQYDYIASSFDYTPYIPDSYNTNIFDFNVGYYGQVTPTPTITITPLPTATPTPVITVTPTPIPTLTPIPTNRPTVRPTATPTPMPVFPTRTPSPIPTQIPQYSQGDYDVEGNWQGLTEYEATNLNLLEQINAKLDKIVWWLECAVSLLLILVVFETLRIVRSWSKGANLK